MAGSDAAQQLTPRVVGAAQREQYGVHPCSPERIEGGVGCGMHHLQRGLLEQVAPRLGPLVDHEGGMPFCSPDHQHRYSLRRGQTETVALWFPLANVYALRTVGRDLAAGAVVASRYRLDRPVGEGGMSAVWAATDLGSERPVALKVLKASLEGQDDLRRRFLAEARLASLIDHPAVVPIADVVELPDRIPVLVMELLSGETLAEVLERDEALDLAAALAILVPVAEALAVAHERGIVHRDLKPENVFLAEDGGGVASKVLDFGVAKLLNPDDGSVVVTRAGRAVGTLCYMAPEQAFGDQDIDGRVDIWALGVVTYECLSGVRPIEVETVGHLLRRLANEAVTPLQVLVPDAPPELTTLVTRMLSFDRQERPAAMSEVVAAFRSLAGG